MSKRIRLSDELDAGADADTYNVLNSKANLYKNQSNQLFEKRAVNASLLKQDQAKPYEITQRQEKKARRAERAKTKGKEWYNMPVGDLTEENKNDLELIKMRSSFHKDKFFKSNDSDTLPKYFQMGKVVDGPLDFYSDRVTKRQQKRTILEELIEDAKVKKFAKKHFSAIQTREEARRRQLSRIAKRSSKIQKNKTKHDAKKSQSNKLNK